MRSDSESSSTPGAALIGFWPALAALLLAFNVFYLRKFHAGLISGKLSDFAASFLLPIFLVASTEWFLALLRVIGLHVEPRLSKRGILIACLVGAGYFTLLKSWPAFTDVHRTLLSWLDAPFGGKRYFRNLADPTDLVALICYPLAGFYMLRKSRREN